MRLVFMATGDIALPAFVDLLENGPKPLALVTQPDKPVGRHQQELVAPEIKKVALAAGVPVFQPIKAGDAVEQLAVLEPEVIVVMAYGQILRENLLTLPSKAILNLHASLLPKYRGAACIQAAIDAGDTESGITSLHVVRELDAGDVILKKSIPISEEETGGTLHDRLAALAVEVLRETLSAISAENAPRFPQNPLEVSYVPKLAREDGRLDWTLPASVLERRIRAYDPWPGTFALALEGGKQKRLKIFPATKALEMKLSPGEILATGGKLILGCGEGALELFVVQPEGGKRMDVASYLAGRKPEKFL